MTQPKEMSNTMSELNAYNLAIKELQLDDYVPNTFMKNGIVDRNMAQKRLPKAEIWAAREIAEMLEDRLTYDTGSHKWHIWNGIVHLPCEGNTIAMRFIQLYYNKVAEGLELVKESFTGDAKVNAAMGADKSFAESIKKYNTIFGDHKAFRDRLANTRGQQGVMAQLQVILGVEPDHYDDDRRWAVFLNGVIDSVESAKQGKPVFLAHDAKRPVWRYINANYDPSKKANWLEYFLRTSLADDSQATFLQTLLGGVIIGAPVKTKTVLDAYGATNSGKSMMNNILEKLCGDYYSEVTEPAVRKGSEKADMYRDSMRNARIVTVLEAKAKLDKSFILKYTGGDTIETSAKYRNNIKWKPEGVMIFMSNDGMNLDAQEDAVADRIERINFPHTFKKNAENPEHEVKEELEEYILAEADGFATWLVDGYMMYLKNNVGGKPVPSESMALLKMEMQDEDNTFSIFWEVHDGKAWQEDITAPDYKKMAWVTCYGKYKKWAQQTGHDIMDNSDCLNWAKRQGYVSRVGNKNRLTNRVYNNMADLIGY